MSFKENKQAITHKLFPTLILEMSDFFSKQECKDVLKKIDKKHLKKYSSLIGKAYTSYESDINFLNKLNNSVKTSLLVVAEKYSEMTGFNIRKKFVGSWFNIQKEKSCLKEHTHPLSTLSGILYSICKEGSFNTYFFNPNPMLDFTDKYKNTDVSINWVSFKPKVGTLLLFPSWLKHGSNQTQNKCSERIVMSFNLM